MTGKVMGPRRRICGACLGVVLAAGAAVADVSFQAWVDRQQVAVMEPVTLTLSVESDKGLGQVGTPELDLSAFHVEGPLVSTRTSVNIVNLQQRVSHTRELVYTLYPRRAGLLTIGPARIVVDGRPYSANAITLEVTPGRAPGAPKTAGGTAAAASDQVFVRVRPSRDQVYVGEPVILEYELCYRIRLENVGLKTVPAFAGFWVKELFAAQTLQDRREVIGGTAYNVALLRRVALFPTRAGRQVVEPLVVSCDIPVRRAGRGSLFDDIFEDPFFARPGRTVLVPSDSVLIRVLPLPDGGKPPLFAGAVGDFDMRVELAPAEVSVGDPVTLRVTVEGWGNMDAIPAPQVPVPPGARIHDPEIQTEARVAGDRVGGTRVFEYILIPDRGGLLQLEPVRFAFFDPGAARYRVLERAVPPARVQASSASGHGPAWGGWGAERHDIEALGTDIRYIKPDTQELGNAVRLHASWIYWLSQALLPVAFGGLVLHQRHRQRLQGDVAYARRRRARGEAARRLARASQLLAANDGPGFHAEIQRAVLAFLSDRLNLPVAGLGRSDCVAALAARGVSETLQREVADVIEACEVARFAQAAADRAAMERLHERAARLVEQLGKLI